MTITTPRLRPTSFIAHFSAFWAYFCSFVSIVSVSESPGLASLIVWSTCVLRPDRVALDALGAVDAAQLGLVLRLEAGLADQVVGQVARRP